MKKVSHIFCLIALLLIVGISCDKSVFYEKNQKIDKKGWNTSDKLLFEVDVKDTTRLYNFYLNVRNTTDYPNQNVFFFINTTFPNGAVARDTVECMLADDEGRWTGKGGGKVRDNRFLFKPRVIFPMSGIYKFEIEHAMRENIVTGLSDVGLRISYTNP